LAEGCNTLYLYDAAPAVVSRLRGRYEHDRRIRVVDDEGLRRIPPGSLNLIMVVSVIQYISQAELVDLIVLWHRLLRPGGQLIVADVIEPDTPLYRDVLSRLRFARRNGFLIPALIGLGRMFFSDYRALRRKAGFSTYQPDKMLRMLYEAGFEAAPLPGNIGPDPHRRSFAGLKLANQTRVAAQ
jgi:ubiquinone/menaquinone biosynthesis C-methylase UbiE